MKSTMISPLWLRRGDNLFPPSAHYMADSEDYTDNTQVALIHDRSGNGYDLTPIATQPVFFVNKLDGKPAFQMVNSTVKTASKVFGNSQNAELTGIFLVRTTSAQGALASNRCFMNTWWSAGAPQDGYTVRGDTSVFNNLTYFHPAQNALTLTCSPVGAFNNDTWYIYWFRRTALNVEQGYNSLAGSVSGVITGWLTSTMGATQFAGARFSNATNSSLWKGDWAEWIIFEQSINDKILLQYINYLKSKYGLTL